MSKFKIGDRVRFCSKINPDKRGYKNGDIFTIQALSDFTYSVNRTQAYSVGKIYVVFENELTLITNSEIHITTDGKTTHAVLKENGKVTKRAKADCSPDDDFDFKVGARLAFDRLFGEDEPKQIPEKFEPHLMGNGKNYGIIGTETIQEDLAGERLKVGDTVLLYGDTCGLFGERTVCSDDERPDGFVMGTKCSKFIRGRSGALSIIKKRSYTEIKHGEKVFAIEYIKERK